MLSPPLKMRCGRSHCCLVTVSREQKASVTLTAANILRETSIFLEIIVVDLRMQAAVMVKSSLTAFYSDDNLRSRRNKHWNKEEISRQRCVKFHRMTRYIAILTAVSSGLTPRYFPFPQPTSASMLPGESEDRKLQTRGQGEWRVLLKWEAMALYTRCTYSSSRWAASVWQQGSEGRGGSDVGGAEEAP